MLKYEEATKILDGLNQAEDTVHEWIMLKLDEEKGLALVVSKECIAKMPFNIEWAKITWAECTLRKWLNGEFYASLPVRMRERMVEAELENKDACTVPGGSDTIDRVFLLTVDDYNAMPEELRAAKYNGAGCWYWLRTPGYDSYNFANVNRCGGLDGGFDANGKYVGHGYHVDSDSGAVRPACWLDLNP